MGPKILGKNPDASRLEKLARSVQYQDGIFKNTEPTPMLAPDMSYLKLFAGFINRPSSVMPAAPLPSVQTNLKKASYDKPTVTWFGHSSYLLQMDGFNVLVDPVFSGYASPVPVFGKAFAGADVYTAEDMPAIDVLVLTHDHYDHLDYLTVIKLKDKVKHVVTSLGVGSHLEYWGYKPGDVTELDWLESKELPNGVKFTAVPARHFSGRGITRAKTLWSAFVLQIDRYRVFLGGDSGYGKHFKQIGKNFGSFDLAILENGQYGEGWPNIHMMPEETVQAARDLDAKMLLPVHWAKFVLSNHPWNESPERAANAAEKLEQPIVFPLIGEPYTVGNTPPVNRWWQM